MNADNVVRYGKFAHEVALQGGVDAYKATQKALINTIKEKSFQEGVSAGKKGQLPWLIAMGVLTTGLIAYSAYNAIKEKSNEKKLSKAQLAKNAEEAERLLSEVPIHEDIVQEYEDKNDEG